MALPERPPIQSWSTGCPGSTLPAATTTSTSCCAQAVLLISKRGAPPRASLTLTDLREIAPTLYILCTAWLRQVAPQGCSGIACYPGALLQPTRSHVCAAAALLEHLWHPLRQPDSQIPPRPAPIATGWGATRLHPIPHTHSLGSPRSPHAWRTPRQIPRRSGTGHPQMTQATGHSHTTYPCGDTRCATAAANHRWIETEARN